MELIQYAYIALITFVFLAVIAIGISYLSYKKKLTHTNQNNVIEPLPQNIIQKQIVHEHKSVANKIVSDINKQILPAEKKIEIDKQEKNRNEKHKKNSEVKINVNSERMQVIKDLSNKKNSRTRPEYFSSINDKQINKSDESIIDRYNEKNDGEFYAPNTDVDK